MQWAALAIAVVIVTSIVVVTLAPVRLELSVKGHGEFGKFWALAMGGQILFVTVTFAAAHGIDSIFQLHVFGRRVVHVSPFARKVVDTIDEHKPSLEEFEHKTRRLLSQVERWFDLDDLLVFLVDLRHRVHMQRFNGRLSYATPDLAITGILSGSLFTFAGLLSPFGNFQVEPLWVDVAKASGNLDVAFRFYPGRMVLDAITFTFKKIKLRQRTRPRPAPAPP